MPRLTAACAAALLAVLATTTTSDSPGSFAPLTRGEWITPAGDPQGTRFSPLKEITTDNVKSLKEVWNYTTGVLDGHEGHPLVVDGMMYVVTPFPDKLIAFDLSKPGPAKQWEYDAPVNPFSFGKACCDDVNRGAAYANGKIIYNTLDDHTVAVDARSGKLVWSTTLGDPNKGETMTMAPLVVRDRVIVGVSGGEMGVWGWAAGLDVQTGKEVWRHAFHVRDRH